MADFHVLNSLSPLRYNEVQDGNGAQVWSVLYSYRICINYAWSFV